MKKETRKLAAYVDQDLSPSETQQVEAVLAESPESRRRVEQYRGITQALSAPVPELEALNLAQRVRQAAAAERLRQTAAPDVRSHRWLWWSGALAAAACLALLVRAGDDGFRNKGGAGPDGERWAGVQLYRVEEGRAAAQLAGHLSRGDGVLVSYSNLGPKPFSHLMVFAVDATGRVWWLHPAWERADEDPESLAIVAGSSVELRSLIHLGWAPGPVTVHALFTHAPLHVRQAEARLARGEPIDDSMEQRFSFTVEP